MGGGEHTFNKGTGVYSGIAESAQPPKFIMRYYSKTVKQRIKSGPNTPGLELARLAILRAISIKEIAYLLGASRMTVYNWFSGGTITNAYRPRVTQLVSILKTAPDNDAAWSTACMTFHPQEH